MSFRNVNFSYEPGRPVLRDFSLKVPSGKKVALVGATGSGKTTVVNLLTRFYQPDSGEICVNGQDIRDISLDSLLEGRPEAMLLFVGAANCARHRADQLAELMRAGRLALLCPTAADYATGRYLHQITDAMVELSEKKGVKEFVVMYGCQWAVLSTDFEMLARELKDGHGITATLNATCHLCGNAQGGEDDHREKRGADE